MVSPAGVNRQWLWSTAVGVGVHIVIVLEFLLTLMAEKHHVKVSEVIPPLLVSKLGQRKAGFAGWWLLNRALCLVCAKALMRSLKIR